MSGGRRFGGEAAMLAIAVPGVAACGVALVRAPVGELLTPLTAILVVCAIVGSRISFDIEGTLFWDGSFLPIICAAALLGPMPTAAATIASEAEVWRRERYARKVLLLNLLGTLGPNLAAASIMTSAAANLDSAAFYGVLAAVVCGSILVNAALITTLAGILYDAPILARFRRHRAILGPLAVNVVLAMGAVAVYRGEGIVATAFVIGGVFVFAFVAGRLRADREQRAEIAALATSRGRLVAQILEAEDRERRVVAEVIHDDLIQTLLVARQNLAESTDALPHVAAALDDAIRQARQIIQTTHPTVLDHVGLDAAVRAVAEQAAARGNFALDVDIDPAVPGEHDRLLFAAVRELLSNVVRHARAGRVAITMTRDSERLRLVVTDDGVGLSARFLSPSIGAGHIGLWSLRERVEALGGTLDISASSGTRVELTILASEARPAEGPTPPSESLASVSEH